MTKRVSLLLQRNWWITMSFDMILFERMVLWPLIKSRNVVVVLCYLQQPRLTSISYPLRGYFSDLVDLDHKIANAWDLLVG
jgi:hypothetical protein